MSDRETNRIEENVLLELLRAGLQLSPVVDEALFGQVDWQALYSFASVQGVSAVLWDVIVKLNLSLPRSLKLQWACHVEQVEKQYDRHQSVLSRLAGYYASHGIEILLLKGLGLSLCYPEPSHRPCGDIDIWLYGRQQQADALLRREKGVSIDEDKHHHTVFHVAGVMVENHYDFLNIHSHLSNRAIESRLCGLALQTGETIEIGGHAVNLPGADFNALFLLRHTAMHFAAGEIVLRHLVDWAMFVRRYHARIDWASLERIARNQNMDRFLHSLNALSIDCLGLDPDLFPVFERDAVLEQRVLNDILHPEFDEPAPKSGLGKILLYKFRRWWANRWKHKIVYREGLFTTFFVQLYAHLLKPASLWH